jgi:DNA-directed RNA polymerase specialized sigma24 family protein
MADASLNDEDDETLLIRIALDQDKDALSTLLVRYGSNLKGYLTKHYGDTLKEPEIAEAVNRAFFNIWRFADRYKKEKGNFRGWMIRIAQNAALSIIRVEDRHQAKELEYDPSYDPTNHCEDEAHECGSTDKKRVKLLNDIIDNQLVGLEHAIAKADRAEGQSANADRLATIHGTSKNVIWSTRSQLKVKLRKMVLDRESQDARQKGKK